MIIVWRVLDRCNLACPFCLYDKRLPTVRKEADPERISRTLDMLGAWRDASGQAILLSWLGGEPLLWPPLAQLSAKARTLGIGLSLTTNGTTLGSPEVRAELIRSYREVTISIDGFSDFHDAMRGWKGAFSKLAMSVPKLVAERDAAGSALRIRANVVLMRGNIGQFAGLCRELSRWGIEEISFNQLGGRDRPEFYPANRLQLDDVRQLKALLPALRLELERSNTVLLGGSAYLDRIEGTTIGTPLPVPHCRVAENFLFIDEGGSIAPCSFTPGHFDLHVDQLRTAADFGALLTAIPELQRTRPARDCADCPSTQQFDKFEAALGTTRAAA